MIEQYKKYFSLACIQIAFEHGIVIAPNLSEATVKAIDLLIKDGKIGHFNDINKKTADLIHKQLLMENYDFFQLIYIVMALQSVYENQNFRVAYKDLLDQYRSGSFIKE
jgi:hypothetical protein